MYSRLPTRPGQLHSYHRSLAPRRNRLAALSAHISPHRFTPGAHSFATQNRNWRTPTLRRMLKEKQKYKARNCEKLLVHEQAEDRARESQRQSE